MWCRGEERLKDEVQSKDERRGSSARGGRDERVNGERLKRGMGNGELSQGSRVESRELGEASGVLG